MTDQPPKIRLPFTFEKGAFFRVIHSNFFRYRVGAGDISLVFGTIVDGQPGTPNTVLEEVTVAMSWNQAKMVHDALTRIIKVIEDETGEIRIPRPDEATREAEQTNLLNMVKSAAGIRKTD